MAPSPARRPPIVPGGEQLRSPLSTIVPVPGGPAAQPTCKFLHITPGRSGPFQQAGPRARSQRWPARPIGAGGPCTSVQGTRKDDGALRYGTGMKSISTITVSSELPTALEPLRELARNSRCSGRRQTVDLSRSLDTEAFVASAEHPTAMLPCVPAARLAEAARDQTFPGRMRGEVGALRTCLDSGRWLQRTVPAEGSDIS